jgi:hypothetical protein
MAGPTSRSIKIDAELWKKIKVIIAAADGEMGIQDYVNDVLRPVVEKDYPKALKKPFASGTAFAASSAASLTPTTSPSWAEGWRFTAGFPVRSTASKAA